MTVAFSARDIAENHICLVDLLLQGCSIEGNYLRDVETPGGEEFVKLENIYVAFIGKDAAEPYPQEQKIELPVYSTFERERLICEFRLPYKGDKNNLIIMGSAIALT